jgi:uncharacterized protein
MTRRYRTIDADGHVTESPDLWQRYTDPAFRERAPRFFTDADGTERIVVEDTERVFPADSGGFGGATAFGEKPAGYLAGRKGGFDPSARIPDMDVDGIDAAFLYPSMGLQFINFVEDPSLAAAICRAYNRWLADYCSTFPDRLFGVAMLPMQSVEVAVQEAQFARIELGMLGGFLRPNPCHGRTIYDPLYDPLWVEAQELDLAVGLHEGTGVGIAALGADRSPTGAMRHTVTHTFEMMTACAGLILTGVCERFPRVRLGFLESGGGWMAPWLDRMDRHVKGYWHDADLAMLPSEYFHRQCWVSFEPVEGCLAVLADYIGPEKVLWASDYPHVDGFAGSPNLIRSMGMPEDTERRVLAEGAIRFYNLGDPRQLMAPTTA